MCSRQFASSGIASYFCLAVERSMIDTIKKKKKMKKKVVSMLHILEGAC